ncbi:hypothetical protein CYY_001392 [Polysphondylium violaceum]|uniref:Uncharacterized protein n=1 Tax=Polysphondylium violaceum TaxID=133409 RepID=A0A8J4UW96_9MYCE|nr:hypothetical protein CYY_001392 [Polysphondylium violaceum]
MGINHDYQPLKQSDSNLVVGDEVFVNNNQQPSQPEPQQQQQQQQYQDEYQVHQTYFNFSNPQYLETNVNLSQLLEPTVGIIPCDYCLHKALVKRHSLAVIFPLVFQFLMGFTFSSYIFIMIAPIIGLFAIYTKSRFIAVIHFITIVVYYLIFSAQLTFGTVIFFKQDIISGLLFTFFTVAFIFIFVSSIKSYSRYIKVLGKRPSTNTCTCESFDPIIVESDSVNNNNNSNNNNNNNSPHTSVSYDTASRAQFQQVPSSVYPGLVVPATSNQYPIYEPQPQQQNRPMAPTYVQPNYFVPYNPQQQQQIQYMYYPSSQH